MSRRADDPRAGRVEAVFQPEFLEDLRYWVANDRRVALRLLDLVEAGEQPAQRRFVDHGV